LNKISIKNLSDPALIVVYLNTAERCGIASRTFDNSKNKKGSIISPFVPEVQTLNQVAWAKNAPMPAI